MDLMLVLRFVKGYYRAQECSATSVVNELNNRKSLDFKESLLTSTVMKWEKLLIEVAAFLSVEVLKPMLEVE